MATTQVVDPSLVGAVNPVGPLYSYDPYMTGVMILMALEIIAVLGRVYVRAYMVKAFGWDDWACVATCVCAVAFNACIIELWRISGLKSFTELPRPNIMPSIHLMLTIELMYLVTTMGLKISLGLLLLRIIEKRWMRVVIHITVLILVLFGSAYFGLVLFQCGPPSLYAQRVIMGRCLPIEVIDGVSYTHAVLTAVGDMVFAVLPVIFVYQSSLSRSIKFSVGGILVLGSFGCICTFIRIGWIHWLTAATLNYLTTSRGIILMSCMEISIGLVCISLATYKPIFNSCLRRRDASYYYRQKDDEITTATSISLKALSGTQTPALKFSGVKIVEVKRMRQEVDEEDEAEEQKAEEGQKRAETWTTP